MTQSQFFGMNIGQKFVVKDFPQQTILAGVRGHRIYADYQEPTDFSFIDIKHCKLILKPMSEMTDEHYNYLANSDECNLSHEEKWVDCISSDITMSPLGYEKCIEWGYDIFDGRSRGWVVYEGEVG